MHIKKGAGIAIVALFVLLFVVFYSSSNSRTRGVVSQYSLGSNSAGSGEMAMMMDAAIEEGADFGIAMNKATTRTSVPTPYPEPPMEDGSVAADVDIADRLIIKNGSLGVVVENVREAAKAVQVFAEGQGGFVVSSNIYENGLAPNATVFIRIPSKVFDATVSSVRGLGEVEYESISGRDVTEEFVDLEAQLGNYKATEAQFLTIMTRATEIRDVLDVQRELSQVRGQIERVEGRMKYLQESAAFSSLTVDLSTDPAELPVIDDGDKWKPIVVVKEAVRGLIDLGQGVVNALIWIVIYAPVWLVVLLIVWLVRRRVQRTTNM